MTSCLEYILLAKFGQFLYTDERITYWAHVTSYMDNNNEDTTLQHIGCV